ncbi:MAG TPA: PKD domain-containing protein [Thermoplasmata archaeon]|nr:PKD domain-containing protein [Thermoplasmata archaeon]
MLGAPASRVPSVRLFSTAMMIALFAASLFVFMMPAASAAPPPPYFGPNVQVDRVPAYTAGNPSLAVGSDGVAYLAFAGWGGTVSQTDIFFTKSSDGGLSWATPVRVNNDATLANSQYEPSLALDGANNIYIVWTDPRNGDNDVYFSKSINGGLTFSANLRVNDVTTNSQSEPRIAIDPLDPNLVHVVWTDTRSPILGPDIYYANSTDAGVSFNPSIRVNNDASTSEQGQPAIAIGPDRSVNVVWSDPRTGARGRDIMFAKSSNRGLSWGPNVVVNDDTGNAIQSDPTIALDEAGTIYVAWTDYRNANTASDIYATRSTNGGTTFALNAQVNDDGTAMPQLVPSLAVSGGKIQVAWSDCRTCGSTSYDIYTASSADGLTWGPNMKVNDNLVPSDFQFQVSIAADAVGDIFAAFLDTRSSGQDVYAATLDVVPPTANAGPAITVDQGAVASFDGSGSSDNLGIAGYSWDFGDGSTGTGVAADHQYPNAGTYTATLTVWDYSGNAATSSVDVTVRDTVAPVPRGGGDRTVDEAQPLFFDASASTDNVGIVSYQWDFGDGTTANTATANHVYSRPGQYSAKLTVTDAAGNVGTSQFTVSVRSSALLGMIQILEGVIAALAVTLAFLAWMVWGMRKREGAQTSRGTPMAPRSPPQPPAQPMTQLPAQPTAEPDPLDMTLPGSPPGGP